MGSDDVHEHLLAQLSLGAWCGNGDQRKRRNNAFRVTERLDELMQHGHFPLWLTQRSSSARRALNVPEQPGLLRVTIYPPTGACE